MYLGGILLKKVTYEDLLDKQTGRQNKEAKRAIDDNYRYSPDMPTPNHTYTKGLACIQKDDGEFIMVDQIKSCRTGLFIS